MRLITLVGCAFALSLLTATAHAQNPYTVTRPGGQTTVVTPLGNGGYVATTPGYGTSYGTPNGSGGYVATTPGYGTSFANPTGNGGYIITTPGAPPSGMYGSSPSPTGGMYGR